MADSILDHPVISQRYFFPRRAPLADPFVVESGGTELHCSLHCSPHEADESAPLLVHFHGNGEVVGDWLDEWPAAFAARGISTLFGEYRGYGGSSGEPKLAAMLDDAVAIAGATGTPPSRIVAYGRSVGSIYALHAASELGLAGLVLESGIADVGERLLLRMRPDELGVSRDHLRDAIAGTLDHRAKLKAFAGETVVFHASGDDLVPVENGERLAAWAKPRARLHIFDRGDHNSIHAYNGDEIIELTAAFVEHATCGRNG